MKIKKAVFPVAGFGTRFLPATKAMPKELLPIVDKPLIQYAAEEAISAGIDTLIFVTGRNKRAIENHFDASDAPSNLASIGRYVLTPDIFETLRGLGAGSGGEIQLADETNIHAQQGSVKTVRLNGRRFDSGSVDGFMHASAHEYKRRVGI